MRMRRAPLKMKRAIPVRRAIRNATVGRVVRRPGRRILGCIVFFVILAIIVVILILAGIIF